MMDAIRQIGNDLKNRIFIGVVSRVRDAGEALVMQVAGRQGELRDNVTVLYPFGFDAYPMGGSEGLVIQVGGNARVMLPPIDRGRRGNSGVTAGGDVALYNDKARITLKEDGTIEIRARRIDWIVEEDVTGAAPGGMTTDTPLFETSGDISDHGGAGATPTISAMRSLYDTHTHPDHDGQTDPPSQTMG